MGATAKKELAGNYVISQELHERTGADQFDISVFIAKRPGVSDAKAEAAIAAVTDEHPNAKLRSRDTYVDAQAKLVNQFVNLMYGLLSLAVIIAVITIANSMVLSIHERTRELGTSCVPFPPNRPARPRQRSRSVLRFDHWRRDPARHLDPASPACCKVTGSCANPSGRLHDKGLRPLVGRRGTGD